MSGRIYDTTEGIPTCKKCRRPALRSDEVNWDGAYCPKCGGFKMFEKFDTNHPLWKGFEKYQKQFHGKLIEFDKLSFPYYKKKMKYNLKMQFKIFMYTL